MKNRNVALLPGLLAIFLLLIPASAWCQRIIIDHTCTRITQIPESAIVTAKQNLHIAYGHTSHGSQLITGMDGLVAFANNHGLGLYLADDIFAWNDGGTDGALDLRDYAMGGDVGYYPDWVNNTRTYLGAVNSEGRGSNHPDINVIIWSWCGQAAGLSEQQMITNYLSPMTNLENEYFDVKFVYMTGHLDGSGSAGNLNVRNNQIRAYCNSNNKILYDFADIESYDPDGLTHYMPLMCTDNCDYDSDGNGSLDRNWAIAWENSHTENVDWYNCSAAHSQALNGNLKAYAAWWLWARLGGWSGGSGIQYNISGRVVAGSNGLPGVVMTGMPGNPSTNGSGYYSAWVDAGWSGTATPTLQYYAFDPASTTYTAVAANQTTNYATTLDQALVVTDPAGASIWERGQTYAITWLKQGPQSANVKILLYKGTATLVKTIIATTPNDGSYDWLVPATLAGGSTYFIKVQTLDNKISDNSDKFSIIIPSITVKAPATGSRWIRGTARDITWTTSGTVNANIKIQLYKGTAKVLDITPGTPTASGTFTWDIPPTLAAGINYSIRITALDNLVKSKTGRFAIAAGIITVTAPVAGTIWQRGIAHTITWTGEGGLNTLVKIQLYKGTMLKASIAASTENDGSFEWMIPAAQALAANYKIRISTVDGLVKGESGRFAISNTSGLVLLAPNGVEILKPAASQLIRWQGDPSVLEVKLEFSRDNGSTFSTIADHVPNTGRYEWLVPVNFTRNAIVRVSDANGRPWQDEALLEYSFRFCYVCENESQQPAAVFWFGSSDPQSPGYGFAKVVLARGAIQFSGFSKNVETLNGSWHELRVRFDLHHDTGALYLDEKPLFENIPLFTSHGHYFEPYLALQAGMEVPVDFRLDDLQINVIQLDAEGNDRELFTVLTDPFERYDEKANALQNCWRLKNPTVKESTMAVEAETGDNKALRLQSVAGKPILIYLPLDIPARIPFDISDQCFAIENQ